MNEMEEYPMYRFVITGGPCGGKTTGLCEVQNFLRDNGFRVFVACEAATILLTHGAKSDDLGDTACQKAFQDFVINTQLTLEDSIAAYAKTCKQPCVILCDRGIMDGAAYVSKEIWSSVLAEKNMDTLSAREGRYNAVFHLVTAAKGAEAYYTLENNDARHETAEEARVADDNTQAAWHGHPHHIVIDNRNGRPFDQKIAYLKSVVASYVGLPSDNRHSAHKYKLSRPPDVSSFPDHTEVFEIEKVMLSCDDYKVDETEGPHERILSSWLRKRSQGDFHAYGLTNVKQLPSGEIVQTKCIINATIYSTLLSTRRDPKRHVVKERRYCFRTDHQSIHVSEWLEPSSRPHTWFVLIQCEADPIIPPFLETGPELGSTPSEGKEYTFSEMSLK